MEAKCSQAVCARSDSIKPGAFSSVTQATLRFLAQEMTMKTAWRLLPTVRVAASDFRKDIYSVSISLSCTGTKITLPPHLNGAWKQFILSVQILQFWPALMWPGYLGLELLLVLTAKTANGHSQSLCPSDHTVMVAAWEALV